MWLYATLFVVFASYIITHYIKLLTFWRNKGIKYVTPLPIVGNTLAIVLKKKALAEFIQELYDAFPGERSAVYGEGDNVYVPYITIMPGYCVGPSGKMFYLAQIDCCYMCGVYQLSQPILLIRDPELAKKITIKEFDSFVDHYSAFTPEVDPLWGKNLFASKGDRWRDLRQTLSPIFTSSKMRMMFELMDKCGEMLVNFIEKQKKDVVEFEMSDIFSKYTINVIASIAFGVEVDSLNNPDSEFRVLGKKLVSFTGMRKLLLLLYGVSPKILKFFGIKIVRDDVGTFFRGVINEALKARSETNIIRPDLIHLLLEARKGRLIQEERNDAEIDGFASTTVAETGMGKRGKTLKGEITDEDITAQALIFYFGGFDTTSILMSFTAYELCLNPVIQSRLREEIEKTKEENNGKLNYEAVLSMKYLDMVISEVLRKWTIAVILDRLCTKQFTIEPERPNEKPLRLEPGTLIWIPVWGIHRDPQFYPNPEVFDPERFSDENKSKIIPGTYMGFGAGPRSCIGNRFALLETKLLFCHLLSKFEIVRTDKSRVPVVLDPNALNITAKHGFWFGFKKLHNKI